MTSNTEYTIGMQPPERIQSGNLPIHWLLLFSVVIAMSICAYQYAYAQNYNFFIEGACTSEADDCYTRDCDIEYCPPEGLSEYRLYRMAAADFPSCTDPTCSNVCSIEGRCEEIPCATQDEIQCTHESPTEVL